MFRLSNIVQFNLSDIGEGIKEVTVKVLNNRVADPGVLYGSGQWAGLAKTRYFF